MAHKKSAYQNEQYALRLGNRGRLVLPSKLRQRLGIREGDKMILTVEPEGILRLVGLREQVKALQGIFGNVAPGVSLADELIRERRREARKENRA